MRPPLPMDQIQALVGPITDKPFAFVDFAVTDKMGLFMPLSGQCYYAITPEHTHPAYSFVVSFDDHCQVRIDGRLIQSRPGTFSAFSPQIPHQEIPMDKPPRYVAVMVAPAFFDRQLAAYPNGTIGTLRGDTFQSTDRLLAALKEFLAEYEQQAPGCAELLNATALKITHLIIRQLLHVDNRCEKTDHRMAANQAIEYMNRHLDEKITVDDLAKTTGQSASAMAKVFKAETGVSPIEYLRELRLVRAKRMLRDTDEPITQVALACGFNNSSYLSRCFLARFSSSPSAFRKSLQHGRL